MYDVVASPVDEIGDTHVYKTNNSQQLLIDLDPGTAYSIAVRARGFSSTAGALNESLVEITCKSFS